MAERPSAASRLSRRSPAEAVPAARPVGRPAAERVLPVRVSAELAVGDYDRLRDFAHEHRLSHTEVMRRLVGLLDDPEVAARLV